MTSFSRIRISVAVNGTANSIESVLNVGLCFEKDISYSKGTTGLKHFPD